MPTPIFPLLGEITKKTHKVAELADFLKKQLKNHGLDRENEGSEQDTEEERQKLVEILRKLEKKMVRPIEIPTEETSGGITDSGKTAVSFPGSFQLGLIANDLKNKHDLEWYRMQIRKMRRRIKNKKFLTAMATYFKQVEESADLALKVYKEYFTNIKNYLQGYDNLFGKEILASTLDINKTILANKGDLTDYQDFLEEQQLFYSNLDCSEDIKQMVSMVFDEENQVLQELIGIGDFVQRHVNCFLKDVFDEFSEDKAMPKSINLTKGLTTVHAKLEANHKKLIKLNITKQKHFKLMQEAASSENKNNFIAAHEQVISLQAETNSIVKVCHDSINDVLDLRHRALIRHLQNKQSADEASNGLIEEDRKKCLFSATKKRGPEVKPLPPVKPRGRPELFN